MAPLGWSGGSQFNSTVLPVGAPVMVRKRGWEEAVGIAVSEGIVMGTIGEVRKVAPTFEHAQISMQDYCVCLFRLFAL